MIGISINGIFIFFVFLFFSYRHRKIIFFCIDRIYWGEQNYTIRHIFLINDGSNENGSNEKFGTMSNLRRLLIFRDAHLRRKEITRFPVNFNLLAE